MWPSLLLDLLGSLGRLELLCAAGGGTDVDVEVAGDLHCVVQERTGFTTQVCSAWMLNDEREGARGSHRFISPGRGPNRERCDVAGGSTVSYTWLEPSYGAP